MKNEWDMFAAVQQQLDAGAELVTIYMTSASTNLTPSQSEPVQALDEEGQAYELGPDFMEALRTCIFDKRIPHKVHHGSKTLAFGLGLRNRPPAVTLPGEVTLDLLDEKNLDTLNMLSDDDDSNDDWWKPKP
jgi:hypothetical protein